ncbi:HET-domain-containing protein, partial [Sporormia fimetaria CBS 119925]
MTYRYGPLHSPYDFRLLHVSPGVGDQPVHCRLAHDTLGGQTKYHALSYTWGSLEETSTVTVNGCLYNVTANLLSALSNLRHPKKESAFWVDRICIDQSNDDERSQQVAQMRDVYEKAENVDIWLGSHT